MPLPGPDFVVAGRRVPAYRLFGLVGLTLGVAYAAAVGRVVGVEATTVLVATAAGLAASLAVVLLRIATGHAGDLVWSEHEAVVVVATLAVGTLAGDPRPTLDSVTAGLAVMVAAGRIGCLFAGCCHGRPSRVGVRYATAHTAAGFPPGLVGVPVVPTQAIEAGWAVLLALGAAGLAAAHAAPGAVLVLVLGGRAAGRILIEQLRGDAIRGATSPRLWAAASAALLTAATAAELLPAGAWTAAPLTALLLAVASATPSWTNARSYGETVR
jgi:hypothetical protein